MIVRILFIASFLNLVITTNLFSTWQQSVYDSSFISYRSVAISPQKNVLAVGDKGKYAVSTDEGINWYYSDIKNFNDLVLVSAINDSSFIVLDELKNTYLTTDFGKNLEMLDFKFPDKIIKIKFNEKFGIAISNNGSIYKSTDLGMNWILLKQQSGLTLSDFDFSENNEIYVAGNLILKSNDEGKNWEEIKSENITSFVKIQVLDSIVYLVDNKLTYYKFDEKNNIWNNYDIVLNFDKKFRKPKIINFTQLDTNNAIIKVNDFYAPCGAILDEYKTYDCGKNWLRTGVAIDKKASNIESMEILNSEFGIGVSVSGIFYRIMTHDWYGIGYFYEQLNSPLVLEFQGIANYDENNIVCYAIGYWSTYMLNSSDGGQSWGKKYFDLNFHYKYNLPYYLDGISYTPNHTIFFTSNDTHITELDSVTTLMWDTGTLHKTTDMGETFSSNDNPDKHAYGNIKMQDDYNGYIRESSNTIKYTTNAGESWNSIIIPETAASIVNISSIEPGNYFVKTYNNTVIENRCKLFKIFDYGDYWEEIINDKIKYFTNFTFLDYFTGFAVGSQLISDYPNVYRDCIYNTTDGGKTWNDCFLSEYYDHFLDIKFSDFNHGIAFTEKSIFYTSNRGVTWTDVNIEEKNDDEKIVNIIYPSINKVICMTENHIFINNEIVNNDELVGVNEQNHVSENFLVQPNPSNGIIRLSKNDSDKSIYDIDIYDTYGRRCNRFSNYRNNNILDLTELPNGLYFAIINKDSEIQTGKIVINK